MSQCQWIRFTGYSRTIESQIQISVIFLVHFPNYCQNVASSKMAEIEYQQLERLYQCFVSFHSLRLHD